MQASRKGAGQRFRLSDIAPALMRCMGFRCIEFALLIFFQAETFAPQRQPEK
ncbi:MAG: hypothetical protein Q4A85_04085 [Kingella sp. (in: b-proteobacteria)]|nr:hypothetical protein [Kingella sp. (in: b-proteobacteria)]